ncbi:MAG: hypothetical protein JKY37_19075 [Nannocystaceae bacterium]|nr:hypothetical protein [Nannocystaceae bacterium]
MRARTFPKLTRRRDDPPGPDSAAPGTPNSAPPWVVGDALHDMGGPDGAVEYRAHDGQPLDAPNMGAAAPVGPHGMTNKQMFDPGTMIAPTGDAVDRVIVDLYNPGAPVPGPALPDSGPQFVGGGGPASFPAQHSGSPAHTLLAPDTGAAGFAAAPAPVPVQPQQATFALGAEDAATEALFRWLSRRGVTESYFSSYARARDIIWGGNPGGAVDPAAVEAAVERRAPSATPAQLDNLRDLGTLLVQFYGVAPAAVATVAPAAVATVEPNAARGQVAVAVPEPSGELRIELESTATPDEMQTTLHAPQLEAGPVLELDVGPEAAVAPAPAPAVKRHPTLEVEVEVEVGGLDSTPVPQLLAESTADLALGDDELGAGLDDASAGATPLFEVEDAPATQFPDHPTWALPPGFASAWDPRTRDQRPSEILRPPPSPWRIVGFVSFGVLAVAAVVYIALS